MPGRSCVAFVLLIISRSNVVSEISPGALRQPIRPAKSLEGRRKLAPARVHSINAPIPRGQSMPNCSVAASGVLNSFHHDREETVKFLVMPTSELSEILEGFRAYQEYLPTVKDRLPSSAFEFAAAPWHYDHEDHRCPHDSWVDSLTIHETAKGERSQHRSLHISVVLLGAYHDGYLSLEYSDVHAYALQNPKARAGHRVWMIDEIRLSENGLVFHEVSFSNDSNWLIEARNVSVEWKLKIP